MYLQVAVPLRALIRPAFTRGNSRIVLAKPSMREWLSISEVMRGGQKVKEYKDEKSKETAYFVDYKKEIDLTGLLDRE